MKRPDYFGTTLLFILKAAFWIFATYAVCALFFKLPNFEMAVIVAWVSLFLKILLFGWSK